MLRGYSSLLVATAEAEATTRTGRQHTHAHVHTHTQPPTQPFITSKHDMKSLLVREQVIPLSGHMKQRRSGEKTNKQKKQYIADKWSKNLQTVGLNRPDDVFFGAFHLQLL